nr:NAD(P) transhydrogenase subunit alpha [Legionella tunisiensis]
MQGLPAASLLIGPLDNEQEGKLLTWCCQEKVSAFSMNLIPRISRAQSMDSLSSQANLAGYRAVLEGVNHFNRAIPMMMTAAGMIHPAKILILGAGVAGLQAIATAKRLGAVVYAFDVRRAAKEQVESLGAEFIEVSEEDSETSGGYAGETSEDYKRQQAELIDQYAKQSDIVVSTALIPGRKAPILLTKKTVEEMKPGSVIVDLATARGGNCELSKRDKITKHGEVTLIGYSNVAGLVPATASELYATNLVNLIRLLLSSTPPELTFNREDEIIKQALLCHEGNYLPFHTVKEY